MSRLAMAMIAYAVVGALAFTTLSDFRVRSATLLILGLFAFKTWVRRKDVLHSDADGKVNEQVLAEGRSPRADGGVEPM
jgi:uncharacterized membrane protein YfcA